MSTFSCSNPKCRYSRQVKEDLSGMKVKCPKCGSVTLFPSATVTKTQNPSPHKDQGENPFAFKPLSGQKCEFCSRFINSMLVWRLRLAVNRRCGCPYAPTTPATLDPTPRTGDPGYSAGPSASGHHRLRGPSSPPSAVRRSCETVSDTTGTSESPSASVGTSASPP